MSLKSRSLCAGKNLRDAYARIDGADLSWGSAAYVLVTGEKETMFHRYKYALMYADVNEEGFDELLEEHPGVLSKIRETFNKACKAKIQEIFDQSENGEIPSKMKIYMKIFPRCGLNTPDVNGGGNVPN